MSDWLVIGNGNAGLVSFLDADLASQEHWHSISGYVYTMDGRAVLWSSKKQAIITLSTMEAEYIAATHTTKEAIWIQTFLLEIACLLEHPAALCLDNRSAI